MSQGNINSHLRRAAEAIEAAREGDLSAEAEGYLDGVEDLLTHHSDGEATGSEAMMYPSPGALDTIQSRLTEIDQETEGYAAENLRGARAEIIQAILLLDERQGEGRPVSSWR